MNKTPQTKWNYKKIGLIIFVETILFAINPILGAIPIIAVVSWALAVAANK